MGLFSRKKKYEKNVKRDNQFLKNYAIRLHGLLDYTEAHEKVTEKLQKLQQDFQYTVATQVKDAKKFEKRINKLYDELKASLQQPNWDEQAVLLLIQNISLELNEINALRQ